MSGSLKERFLAEFGREPDGVWAAPGRVNLIGEHVDYAGGLCLPVTLGARTVVAAARRGDRTLRLRSLLPGAAAFEGTVESVRPGAPGGWAAFTAGVVWALHQAGHRVSGLDLLVGDSVPPGAGLASSAALECAVALAVDELCALGLGTDSGGRAVLAELCRRAENDIAGAPTGGMDQAAALCCTPGHALLLDCATGAMRLLPFEPAVDGLSLMVLDTRAAHRHVDGEYAARRRSVEQAAAALGVPSLREADEQAVARLADPVLHRRARHVVTEIARVRATVELLERGRLREIGPLLDASHRSLREDAEVSSPELDCVVRAARSVGALGARMTGGGFGGSAIALVDAKRTDAVSTAVRAAATQHNHPLPLVCEVR